MSAPPDASMSLLREAAERSLDPGYAIAARERQAREAAGAPEPDRARVRRSAAYGALALVLGLAGAGAVATLRQPAPPEEREGLLRQIEVRTAEADRAQAEVEALRAETDAAQSQALAGEGVELVRRTELLSLLAATAPVAGPGLRVTLDDAPGSREPVVGEDPRVTTENSQGLVLDRDLQAVVNGLFAAGAEAVAINGQRLTALASIRVAGQAILVGFQPLSPPYVVEAIGDSSDVAARFAASQAGSYLGSLSREYGIQVTSTAHDELTLPGGGVEELRYAVPVAPAGPAGGPSRSPAPSGAGSAASSGSPAVAAGEDGA